MNGSLASSPGNHWILIYFDEKNLILFDSFGREASYFGIEKKMSDLLKGTNRHFAYSNYQLHDLLTETCGGYCLFVVFHLVRKQAFKKILNIFKHHNKSYNEAIVRKFMLKIYDFDFAPVGFAQ